MFLVFAYFVCGISDQEVAMPCICKAGRVNRVSGHLLSLGACLVSGACVLCLGISGNGVLGLYL